MKKALVIAVALFLAYAVLGLGAQEVAFRGSLGDRAAAYQEQMRQHLPAYLADQKALDDDPPFQINAAGTDAGPYLSALVPWYLNGKSEAEDLPDAPKEALGNRAALSPAVVASLTGPPERWLGLSATLDFAPFDFRWLEKAQRYDYWELNDSAPARARYAEATAGKISMFTYLLGYPKPDFIRTVTRLAQIRLMQGVKEGRLLPALGEVRHLAQLCYSTETLFGALTAVRLLNFERSAYLYAVAGKLLPADSWRPQTEEQTSRLRRTILAALGYFGGLMPPELIRQAWTPNHKIPLCAAIRVGTQSVAVIDRHLDTYVPLERDLRGTFKALADAATDPGNGCRIRDLRSYWADPFTFRSWGWLGPAALGGAEAPGIALAVLANEWPYFRKAGGLALAVNALFKDAAGSWPP